MNQKPGGVSRMGALIVVDPATAKAEILASIDAAKGNRTRAAEALGAKHRSLLRWIDKLALWPEIDRLCKAKGYDVQPGPGRR
jgi:hypothetical protein